MLRVRILEEAAQEAIEAATWYEKERAGLGMEFDQALNSALDLLESAVVPLMTMPGTAGASDTELTLPLNSVSHSRSHALACRG